MDKKMIEDAVGMEIPQDLYEMSLKQANEKLQSIIHRYGDGDGVRRTPGYLDELVIEAVKSELLTEYTLALALASLPHNY